MLLFQRGISSTEHWSYLHSPLTIPSPNPNLHHSRTHSNIDLKEGEEAGICLMKLHLSSVDWPNGKLDNYRSIIPTGFGMQWALYLWTHRFVVWSTASTGGSGLETAASHPLILHVRMAEEKRMFSDAKYPKILRSIYFILFCQTMHGSFWALSSICTTQSFYWGI